MKTKPISRKAINNGLKIIVIIYGVLACTFTSKSQGNFDFTLFSLGKKTNASDILYQYKPSISNWIKVGDIGTTEIYSIAIDSENFIIYAVNSGTLGTINPVTAEFTEIGNIGGGQGEYGYKNMDKIYGLTFDPYEKVLYATNRISGVDRDDILVKINPLNGKLIKSSFINSTFQSIDYVTIEPSIDKATIDPSPPLREVSCLLYEPFSGQLLSLQRGFDKIAMSLISKNTGYLIQVILDLTSTGIFSIDYDLSGNLYAATLNELNDQNGIVQVDLGFAKVNFVNPLNISEPNVQIVGLAFLKTTETIWNCEDEINLICTSPQMSEIKAKQSIQSSADVLINTTYKTEDYVSLHNYFSIPAHVDFSIEITTVCD